MARTPIVINNGRLADVNIDGTWYQDDMECVLANGAYGKRVYVREDYMDKLLSRKGENNAVVGTLDKLGVEMKVHYHLPIEAFSPSVYAMCETVAGKIVRCKASDPNKVILRFPTYRNLSALSKIMHTFDEIGAMGEKIYVSFKKEGYNKAVLEIEYVDANSLIKTIQAERLQYLKDCKLTRA